MSRARLSEKSETTIAVFRIPEGDWQGFKEQLSPEENASQIVRALIKRWSKRRKTKGKVNAKTPRTGPRVVAKRRVQRRKSGGNLH